jgi:membrane protein DedA with SNARE-associated domain
VVASLSGSVTSFIGNHGVYAVFLLMLVDAVFPAASELVMLYGGALASGAIAGSHVVLFGTRVGSGFPAFLVVALAGTIGYTIGSLLGWGVGYYGGRPLLETRGRWLHLSPENLDRAERWFDRWDGLAVLVGRVTPVVRSFISIPAGVFRMRLGRYTVLTLVGSAVWAFALAGAGWGFGKSYERFHSDFRFADYAVAALVLAAIAYGMVVWRRKRSSRLAARAGDSPH